MTNPTHKPKELFVHNVDRFRMELGDIFDRYSQSIYLTGSRFFDPKESDDRDYDYFVQVDSPVHIAIGTLIDKWKDLLPVASVGKDTKNTKPYCSLSIDIVEVYTILPFCLTIDIQVVKNITAKIKVQSFIKSFYPNFNYLTKEKRATIWRMTYLAYYFFYGGESDCS